MARPRRVRRLLWLVALLGGAYLIWRRRQQAAHLAPPAYSPPAPLAPPAERPAAAPHSEAATGPRRIPTRVHRGAPPSRPARGEPAEPAPEPPASPGPPAAAAAADAAIEDAGLDAANLAPSLGAATPPVETIGPGADGVPETIAAADEASAATFSPGLAPAPGGPEPEVISEGTDHVDEAREPLPPDPATLAGSAVGLVNINTADEDALVALPGIGRALARRIIAYREEHGPFANIEQLIDIQGIGTRNIEEFRAFVTV